MDLKCKIGLHEWRLTGGPGPISVCEKEEYPWRFCEKCLKFEENKHYKGEPKTVIRKNEGRPRP